MNLKPKRLTDHTKAETGIWTDMGVALLTGVACYLAATR